MKKIILCSIVLLTALSVGLNAQENNKEGKQVKTKMTPEQRAEMSAKMMAEELYLDDETIAKFTPLYTRYKMDMTSIRKDYRPERSKEMQTDEQICEQIKKDFEMSQKILDLRKEYFEKFLKVLTPRQIRSMYGIEKKAGEMMQGHGRPGQHNGRR